MIARKAFLAGLLATTLVAPSIALAQATSSAPRGRWIVRTVTTSQVDTVPADVTGITILRATAPGGGGGGGQALASTAGGGAGGGGV